MLQHRRLSSETGVGLLAHENPFLPAQRFISIRQNGWHLRFEPRAETMPSQLSFNLLLL